MPNDIDTPNPNILLARQIVDKLIETGLIMDKHKDGLLNKLTDEGVKQTDWLNLFDEETVPIFGEEHVDE
jgi:hypothetical protein